MLSKASEEAPGAGSTSLAGCLLRDHWPFLVLLIVITSITAMALMVYNWHLGAAWDTMRLMAITRSMAELNIPPMGGSHLMPSGDPHFSPYMLLLAVTWRVTGMTSGNLNLVYSLFGVMGAGLFTLAIYLFSSFLFGSPRKAALCVIAPVFLWGPVHTMWAGDYSILGMFYGSFVPQTYAYAIGIFCILLYFKFTVMERGRYLLGIAVLFFFVTATHLLTTAFVVLGMACMSFLLGRFRADLGVMGALVAGGLASLLWPFYSLIDSVSNAFTSTTVLLVGIGGGVLSIALLYLAVKVFWNYRIVIQDLVTKYHIWLIGFLAYLAWLVQVAATKGMGFLTWPLDKRLLGGTGLAGLAGLRDLGPANFYLIFLSIPSFAVYWGGKLADKLEISLPLWHRFIFFGMLPLHILMGALIYDQVINLRSRNRMAVAIAGILAASIVLNLSVMLDILNRESFLTPEIEEVAGLAEPGSVVIAGEHANNILAGYYGITTVAPILWEEDDSRRRKQVLSFFQLSTDEESLLKIAGTYSVDILVLNREEAPRIRGEEMDDPAELEEKFDGIFEKTMENDLYIVYSLGLHQD